MSRSRGGVYLIRTRKPGARLAVPFLSTHWGYVGETTSFRRRIGQHLHGDAAYGTIAKPWADLVVSVHYVPLPTWKPLLRAVETLFILLVWPVYNISKNRWNPRRIVPWTAAHQRAARDLGRHPLNFTRAHAYALLALALAVIIIWRMA